jgi:hypothetical protein
MSKLPDTPQEISDYKQAWMRDCSYSVNIHSDLDVQGKAWCRKNLQRWQWVMHSYTGVYEHTFYFEDKSHSEEFKKLWN